MVVVVDVEWVCVGVGGGSGRLGRVCCGDRRGWGAAALCGIGLGCDKGNGGEGSV